MHSTFPKHSIAEQSSFSDNVEDLMHLGSFFLGEQLCAVDILKFREVVCMQPLIKVPCANAPLEGIIDLRNKVVPVISLHQLFGVRPASFGPSTRIVNLDVRGHVVGIIVDSIGKMYHVPLSQVEPLPAYMALKEEAFVYGVCTVAQRMFVILNVDNIVPSVEHLHFLDYC